MALIFITRTQSQTKAAKNVNSVTRCCHLRLKSQYVKWRKSWSLPYILADVLPSRIQRVSTGQWEAEQSTESSEQKLHLQSESTTRDKYIPVFISAPNLSLSQLEGSKTRGSTYLSAYPPPFPPSLPSLFLSGESSCGSSVAREVEAPRFPLPISWGSQSHFLLFSQTQELFKDGRTLTHKTRRTQRWGAYEQTHTYWWSPFS